MSSLPMAEVEARWSLTWGFLWFYEHQLQISRLRKAVALSPCQCSVEGRDLCGCWVWDSIRKQSTESSSGGFYKCRCWGFYLFAFLFLPQRKHFLLIFLPSNDAFLCVLCEVANGSEVGFFVVFFLSGVWLSHSFPLQVQACSLSAAYLIHLSSSRDVFV